MEYVVWFAISCGLSSSSCDYDPYFMALASFDCIIEVLNTLVSQVSFHFIVASAVSAVVSIIPENTN